jgi:drug/metabolite transporter (DMT)-like permease
VSRTRAVALRRAIPHAGLVWLCLGTVYVVWGSTYLAIRVMVRTLPPLLSAGARFAMAGLLLATLLAIFRGRQTLRMSARELAGATLVGTLLAFGGNGLVTVAERHVPSGLAALLIASEPLFVIALRPAIGERTNRSALLAILAGFGGVTLLLLPGDHPGGVSIGAMLLIVLAAFSWASGSVASRRLPLPKDGLVSAALQMGCGGAVMLVVALARGEAGQLHASSFTTDSVLAFVYLVLFGSLAAFTAYAWLLRNAPLGKVTTYAYVNPVVAVVLGWLILGESIGWVTLLAASAIVASVAVTVREEGRAHVRAEREAAPHAAAAVQAGSS